MTLRTKCTRFPRFAKCFNMVDEEASREQYVSHYVQKLAKLGWKFQFSEEELQDLILSFGEAEDLKDGGWILTDGSVLDLQRSRTFVAGMRHSLLLNGMSDDRKAILQKIQSKEELISSPVSIAVDAALAAGFIRYQMSLDPNYFVTYFSVEKKPTSPQMRVIKDIIERVQEESETSLAGKRFTGLYDCGGVRGSFDDPAMFGRSLVKDASSVVDLT